MEYTSLISTLPNLSIGVVSILALLYVIKKFMTELDKREKSMRELENEFREHLVQHINSSSVALRENTKVLERVLHKLNGV